ncbi:MAG: hypothetical protein V4764_07395 [Burkholderia sp.]
MASDRTVLCIPSSWETRADLISSLIDADTGYLFAGGILMERESQAAFRLHFEIADEHMASAFHAAGPHWRGSSEMAAIAQHKSVVYVVDEGGSRIRIEALMAAGAALIDAGGLGVKVESSGVAHSPAQWRDYVANVHLLSAYRAFVVTVGSDAPYTCGMHNFGMKDVRLPAGIPNAAELASLFSWYLFSEEPDIRPGHTFSAAADAPKFRVVEAEGVEYAADSLFVNEFGTWGLVPMEGEL